MSSLPSCFPNILDSSFPHVPMQGYDALPPGFSQGNPTSFCGYGPWSNPVQAPHPFMNYPPSSCGAQAMCDPSASFALQQPCYNGFYSFAAATMSSQMADLTLGEPPLGGIVYIEQRGIHIREISRRTSEEEIRGMVIDATGPEAGLIKLIEAPLDKNRTSRGWASVHFHSADLARRMVDRLNGVEFKGKTLQVKLMKEGDAINGGFTAVTTTGTSGSRQRRGSKHHHRREDSKRAERKERDRGGKANSISSTSDASVPSASSQSVPLVVGGRLTAESTSSSPSSSSKGKEKQGERNTVVIIADGSSGRKSKKPTRGGAVLGGEPSCAAT